MKILARILIGIGAIALLPLWLVMEWRWMQRLFKANPDLPRPTVLQALRSLLLDFYRYIIRGI